MSRALPKAIVDFGKSQPTRPMGELLVGWKFQTKRSFPYQEYIYPMVASLLLSGRVSPTNKELPNRTALVANKGQTLTFKLDARAIKEASARPKSTEAFVKMLQSHQSKLPSTVTSLLAGSSSPDFGKIYIRGCRALIQTETPELLDAIRQHRRLKNFLMSGGPPGYLLIKESSDPWNFIKRCRECGFEIEPPPR